MKFDAIHLDKEDRLKSDDVKDKEWKNLRHKYYGENKIDIIFIIYIIAIILWAFLVIYLMSDCGFFILLIPFLVFFVAIISLSRLSLAVEDEMFEVNFLSTGMLITLPLLSCIIATYKGDKTAIIKVTLMAVTFTILSMIDVWVPEKYLSEMKHIRSILQTISLVLILYSLYMYYSHMGNFPLMTDRGIGLV